MIESRRYDLDWLRLIAFTVLVYFHSAIIFIPGGIPMIQNPETSEGLHWFVNISHQFRLALLFFISGVGVGFAKRRRSEHEFIIERSQRLLIPLVFGILIVVPPMIYVEKLHIGEWNGGFADFYPRFFTQGVYPSGNLSWHHFWFIAYLYLYCLLAMRLFTRFTDPGVDWLDRIAHRASGYGIYWMILPLFVVELSLRAIFPGFRDLIHDWASFFHWFLIFIAGFVIANREDILDNAERLRFGSLVLAVISTVLLFGLFYEQNELQLDPRDDLIVIKYLGYCLVRVTMVWSAILTCLGFASRYLRVSSSLLSYLNEAVYPLFILHLTVIVILGHYAVAWDVGIWTKYVFITTATILVILCFYHFFIRPWPWMRLVFGVKKTHNPRPFQQRQKGKPDANRRDPDWGQST